MREIGGYMELEQPYGEHYHSGVALNSARDALEYIVRLRGIRKIALPDFICSSVKLRCERLGATIREYSIGDNLQPILCELGSDEWLYVVDYYGQLSSRIVEELRIASDDRLIMDETQAFFRPAWQKVDTIYTCRKFFGVPDGGYAVPHDGSHLDEPIERAKSADKMTYVLGRCEDGAVIWYQASKNNNTRLADEPMMLMSEVTSRLMRGIDYSEVRARRTANWETLDGLLGESNLLELDKPYGPYAYPYLLENADGIRKLLAENGIFVPTLWPEVASSDKIDSTARNLAKNILPLPLDQRYDADDMEYVADILKQAIRSARGV